MASRQGWARRDNRSGRLGKPQLGTNKTNVGGAKKNTNVKHFENILICPEEPGSRKAHRVSWLETPWVCGRIRPSNRQDQWRSVQRGPCGWGGTGVKRWGKSMEHVPRMDIEGGGKGHWGLEVLGRQIRWEGASFLRVWTLRHRISVFFFWREAQKKLVQHTHQKSRNSIECLKCEDENIESNFVGFFERKLSDPLIPPSFRYNVWLKGGLVERFNKYHAALVCKPRKTTKLGCVK